MAKFDLKKVTGVQVIVAIALLYFLVSVIQGHSGSLAAIDCPSGDIKCRAIPQLKIAQDWIFDNLLLSIGVIAGLIFFIVSFDILTPKIKRITKL